VSDIAFRSTVLAMGIFADVYSVKRRTIFLSIFATSLQIIHLNVIRFTCTYTDTVKT